jgi:hypothetical protein
MHSATQGICFATFSQQTAIICRNSINRMVSARRRPACFTHCTFKYYLDFRLRVLPHEGVRGASEQPIFNERFCGAIKKWRVLDEIRSTSVFVAGLRRRALKWRVSDEPLSTRVFVALQRDSLENPLFLGPAPVLKCRWKGRKLSFFCHCTRY